MQGAWDVIEKVVGEGAKLRPGATTPALDALAARIQVTLPADLRELLSVHDGQEPEGDGFLPRMHSDVLLLSADEIAIRWAEQKALYEQTADDDAYTELIDEVDDTGRVRQISFHPGRLLIAEGESTRGMVWLDFVPGPRGTTGQVVTCVDVDLEFAAESLPAYLTAVAAQLTELNGVVSELTSAAMNGDIARVRRLLDAGMPVDASDDEETALALAAREGLIGMVSLLLDRGADPNRKTGYGKTPIEYAAQFGNTDVVRLLLDRGTQLRIRDGMTLLHHAARSGRPDLVRLLIEQGFDPNADGPAGTPLTQACASAVGDERNLDVVRALLLAGADPTGGSEDRAPLVAAASAGHVHTVRLLLAVGDGDDRKTRDAALREAQWLKRNKVIALLAQPDDQPD